jgi:O-antigen/teichoic acid export membrane protein
VPQFSVALSNLSGLEGNRAVLYLLVILLVADTLSLEFSRYLTARWQIEESNVVAFLQVSSWALVVFTIFLIDATRVTVTLVLALWMVGMILAILYGVRSAGPAQLWHGKFQPAVYLAAVRFGMPLMLTNLAYLVIFWSDRYFIEIYHSSEAVGVYSYQYNIIAIIVAASAPIIGNVIDPYIVAANNTGDREGSRALLNAALRYQIILVAPILLIVSFWGTELVTLLASAQYASATNLLAVLAPIPVITILANTFHRVLFLRRRTALIGVSYLLAALLNLALNWLLVPRHPYYGAAIATDLSLLFIAILLWHHGRSSSSIVALSELYRIGIPFAAGVAVALATAWVAPWHHPLPSLAVGSLNVAAAYLGSLWFLGGLTQQERALVRRIRLHVFRNR